MRELRKKGERKVILKTRGKKGRWVGREEWAKQRTGQHTSCVFGADITGLS
jgi:hypothetical protein